MYTNRPIDILLKLFHVKELKRLLEFQQSVGKLEDVIADGVFLDGVLDVDIGLAEAFDQNVARLVHFDLASLADLSLEFFRLGVSHWVLEAIHSNSAKG